MAKKKIRIIKSIRGDYHQRWAVEDFPNTDKGLKEARQRIKQYTNQFPTFQWILATDVLCTVLSGKGPGKTKLDESAGAYVAPPNKLAFKKTPKKRGGDGISRITAASDESSSGGIQRIR